MPYTIETVVPNRVIGIHFSGRITFDDVRALDAETTARYDQAASPIHVLLEFHTVEIAIFDFTKLARSNPGVYHPNRGWLIAVGSKIPMLYFGGRTYAKLTGATFHWSLTRADALSMLAHLDPTLVPSNLSNTSS